MMVQKTFCAVILFFTAFLSYGQNVGIGTTTPANRLDIRSDGVDITESEIVLGLISTISNRPVIQFSEVEIANDSSGMSIEYDGSLTSGQNRMHIRDILGVPRYTFLSAGRFGIGELLPTGWLHVRAQAGNSLSNPPHMRITEVGDGFGRLRYENEANPGSYWEVSGLGDTLSQDARLNFWFNNSEIAHDVMSLSGNGMVGVGTSNPAGQLHIVSNSVNAFEEPNLRITEDDYDYARIKLENTPVDGAFWDIAALADTVANLAKLNFFFDDDGEAPGTNILSIGGNGRVGIRTTAPQVELDIHSTAASNTQDIVLGVNSATSNRPVIQFSENPTTSSTSGMSIEYNGAAIGEYMSINDKSSTPIIYFRETGQVGIGVSQSAYDFQVNGTAAKTSGTLWTVPSDRNLKTDISAYTTGLEAIEQIRPVRFHYNEKSGFDTGPEHVGVIAQELQLVAPSMVEEVPAANGGTYLTVNGSEILFMLINAVKELSAQVEQLSARNTEQEQRIIELQSVAARLTALEEQMAELSVNGARMD